MLPEEETHKHSVSVVEAHVTGHRHQGALVLFGGKGSGWFVTFLSLF